jgi:hypothetical protein
MLLSAITDGYYTPGSLQPKEDQPHRTSIPAVPDGHRQYDKTMQDGIYECGCVHLTPKDTTVA